MPKSTRFFWTVWKSFISNNWSRNTQLIFPRTDTYWIWSGTFNYNYQAEYRLFNSVYRIHLLLHYYFWIMRGNYLSIDQCTKRMATIIYEFIWIRFDMRLIPKYEHSVLKFWRLYMHAMLHACIKFERIYSMGSEVPKNFKNTDKTWARILQDAQHPNPNPKPLEFGQSNSLLYCKSIGDINPKHNGNSLMNLIVRNPMSLDFGNVCRIRILVVYSENTVFFCLNCQIVLWYV